MDSGGRWIAIALGAVGLGAGGFLVGRHGGRPPREPRGDDSAVGAERESEPAPRAFPSDLQRFVVPVPVTVQAPAAAPAELTRPRSGGGRTEEELAALRARQAEMDRVMLEEVEPLHTEAELSSYLSIILDRAQTMRSIPATIVEPGRIAIRRVIQDPQARQEREAEFLRSLDELRAKIAVQ